ncbi:MAG: circadian clock KaiB family protein, partial [Pseudomonadota bacterium]
MKKPPSAAATKPAAKRAATSTGKRKRAAPPAEAECYELVLYISGATENSRNALTNIKAISEQHLKGHYRLAVVDLYQQPEQARDHDIFAVPMLVKTLPLPLRRMVGELSSEERV